MNTVADLVLSCVTEPITILLSRGQPPPLHTPCRLPATRGQRRCRFRWELPRPPPGHSDPWRILRRSSSCPSPRRTARASARTCCYSSTPTRRTTNEPPPCGRRLVGLGALASDDRGAEGEAEELAPLVNPELPEDVRQVGGHRSPADVELGRHLGVAQAEGDLPEDLALARRHRLQAGTRLAGRRPAGARHSRH